MRVNLQVKTLENPLVPARWIPEPHVSEFDGSAERALVDLNVLALILELRNLSLWRAVGRCRLISLRLSLRFFLLLLILLLCLGLFAGLC